MNEEVFAILLQFFQTAAQPDRLRLMGLLLAGPHTAPELAQKLGIKETAVPQHLAQLEKAGFLIKNADRTYRLDAKALEQLNRTVFSQLGKSHGAGKEDIVQRVFRRYVQDGRLKELPVNHDELMAVLGWLVEGFDMNGRYTEKEVNQQLQKTFDDYAALRRYLVDYRFMQRENSIYWRLPKTDVPAADAPA